MGKSLDELISFLLEEIALLGQGGASTSDFTQLVSTFYSDRDVTAEGSKDALLLPPPIDRMFEEQVWKWLMQHPDISVGKNGKGKKMSLSELECHNEAILKLREHEFTGEVVTTGREREADTGLTEAPRAAENTDQPVSEPGRPSKKTARPTTSSKDVPPPASLPVAQLRIYTSATQMWYAAAGHGPDLSKIQSLEFDCLSIIAACKEKGIFQPELIRLTGQDKRSLPVRTQRLADNGYIVKKPTTAYGRTRTSLLILTRYAKLEQPPIMSKEDLMHALQNPDDSDVQKIGIPQMESLCREMIDLLEEQRLLTWDDLKRRLGVFGITKGSKLLARSVRLLEQIGSLQRVRAHASNAGNTERLFRCVKFIRRPSDPEWVAFPMLPLREPAITQTLVQQQEGMEEDLVGGNTAHIDDYLSLQLSSEHADSERVSSKDLEPENVGPTPMWTPQRPASNIIYDIIDAQGESGIHLADIRLRSFGDFFHRPLEHQMSRFVDSWQISQPLHLRHLGILRDAALVGKTALYIHYTFPHFKSMVERGLRTWEAVQTIDATKSGNEAAASDVLPDLDGYGFPRIAASYFQGHGYDATRWDSIKAAKIERLDLGRMDPRLELLPDGSQVLMMTTKRKQKSTRATNSTRSLTGPKSSSTPMNVADPSANLISASEGLNLDTNAFPATKKLLDPLDRGRPRKYPKYGLPENASAMSDVKLKTIRSSQKAAQRYDRIRNKAEIERRVNLGKDRAEAELIVSTAAKEQAISEGAGGMSIDTFLETRKVLSAGRGSRAIKVTPYLPSVAAHTWLIPRQSFESHQEEKPRLRASGRFKSALGYFPSTLAHTTPWYASLTQDSRGNGRRVSAAIELDRSCDAQPFHQPFNSTGHEGFVDGITLGKAALGKASRKRSSSTLGLAPESPRKRIAPNSSITNLVHSESPISAAAAITSNRRTNRRRTVTAKAAELPAESNPGGNEGIPSQKAELDSLKVPRHALTYDQQADRIERTGSGVFIGPVTDLRSSIHRGRPKKSQILIFRSPRLAQALFSSQPTPDNQQEGGTLPLKDSLGHIRQESQPEVSISSPLAVQDARETPAIPEGAEVSKLNLPISDPPSTSVQHLESHLPPDSAIRRETSQPHDQSPEIQEQQDLPGISVPVPSNLPEIIVDRRPDTPTRQKATKMTPTGGSLALMRRNIIMEIVSKNGGVFPGDRELWYPFSVLWMRRNNTSARPEQTTVKNIQKYLVDSRKLRQLKFTFNNKNGVAMTKTIITLMSIAPTDPKVRMLQGKIMEAPNNLYVPEEADGSPAKITKRAGSGPLGRSEVHITNLRVENRQKVTLSQTPQVRAIVTMEERLAKKRLAFEKHLEKQRRTLENTPLETSDSTSRSLLGLYGGPLRRVPRLPRLKKSAGLQAPQSMPVGMFQQLSSELTGGESFSGHFDVSKEPATTLSEHRKKAARIQPDQRSRPDIQLRFVANLGPGSNFERDPSSEDDVAEDNERFLDRSLDRVKAPGPGLKSDIRGPTTPNTRPAWPTRGLDLMKSEQHLHQTTGTFGTYMVSEDITPSESQRKTTFLPLPQNLDALLSRMIRTESHPQSNDADPVSSFQKQISEVQDWELKTRGSGVLTSQFHFINHTFPGTHVSTPGALQGSPFPAEHIAPASVNQIKRKSETIGGGPIRKRVRRADVREEERRHLDILRSEIQPRPIKMPRMRQSSQAHAFGEDSDQRLLIAVTVVRTLCGGIDQAIDWELLRKIFAPHWTQVFIQRRWRFLLVKYRLVLDRLQWDFQEKFVKAYESSLIPPIDYANLEHYDWKWLINWTLDHIDRPTDKMPALPACRSQLDELYELKLIDTDDRTDYYEVHGAVTVKRRLDYAQAIKYTAPLQRSAPVVVPHAPLDLARNWARANVITPEASYLPARGRVKLEQLGAGIMEIAVRDLLSTKIIMKDGRASTKSHRNYDISEWFLGRLRTNIEARFFRRAAAFKHELDEAFAAGRSIEFTPNASDGEVMACLNMLAWGRVSLKPRHVPNDPFGLVEDGYKTRHMDKSKYNFDMAICPTDRYIYGHPLGKALPLPRPPQTLDADGTDLTRLPLWIDINGDDVPIMWDLAIAAVLAILAVRPALLAARIEQYLAPALGVWEIDMLLQWIVQAGLGKWTTDENGTSVRLEEWWWLALSWTNDPIPRSVEAAGVEEMSG